jgi:lysophospholipase L1-like esterase
MTQPKRMPATREIWNHRMSWLGYIAQTPERGCFPPQPLERRGNQPFFQTEMSTFPGLWLWASPPVLRLTLLLLVLNSGQFTAPGSEPASVSVTNATPAQAATANQAVVPSPVVRQHWADRVRFFLTQPVAGHPVVLLGDSLTEGFDVAKYFPGHVVLNRGVSSDVIGNDLAPGDNRGVLQRLDCSVFPCPASDVFVLIGINDLGDGHGLDLMEQGYRELLQRLHAEAPDSRLHVESLLPTRGHYARLNAHIRAFNDRLRHLAAENHADYLDLHALLLDEQGELKADCTREGLHLNERGYQIWQSAINQAMGWH